MAKKDEWITLHVKCKCTDHSIGPNLAVAIANLLRGFNIHNHEIDFFWGNEPGQSAASTGLRK